MGPPQRCRMFVAGWRGADLGALRAPIEWPRPVADAEMHREVTRRSDAANAFHMTAPLSGLDQQCHLDRPYSERYWSP